MFVNELYSELRKLLFFSSRFILPTCLIDNLLNFAGTPKVRIWYWFFYESYSNIAWYSNARFWLVISDVLHVISDANEGKKSLLGNKFARCKTGLTECILLLASYRVCYCYNSLVQWVNVFLICTKDIRRNYRYVPLGGAWRCLHICSLIFLFAMYIFDLHIFICNLVILVWFYFCLDSSCLLL